MSNNFPKDDFYFTKGERRGIMVMLLCMILILLYPYVFKQQKADVIIQLTPIENQTIEEFRAGQESKEANQDNSDKEKRLFDFDPNTTPLSDLLQLPINKKVIYTLDNYRKKGGKFKSKEDVRRIYGMEEYFDQLAPHIKINTLEPSSAQIASNTTTSTPEIKITPYSDDSTSMPNLSAAESKKDSLSKKSQTKEKPITKTELNSANIYQLQLIPGIGEVYANRIVEFRTNYGGFAHIDQLAIAGIRKESIAALEPYLSCNPKLIRKRSINRMQLDSLRYIPSIPYNKLKVAHNYTRNHYPVKDVQTLKKMVIFTEDEIQLLSLYISFDY